MIEKTPRIYIGIGGIETLGVENILRRYIGIGGVEPLLVKKISIRRM